MFGYAGLFVQTFLKWFKYNILSILAIFVVSLSLYLSSEVLSHYKLSSIINSEIEINSIVETVKNSLFNYKFASIYKSDMTNIYLFFLVCLNLYIFIYALMNRKYINLPYALGFFNQVKEYEQHQKNNKVFHDVFLKKLRPFGKDSFILYFRNSVSISLNSYNKQKKEIAQYLEWDGEIKVSTYGNKGVQLLFYKIPIKQNFDNYKIGLVNFGRSILFEYEIPINNLTHTVIVGTSGCGKSNLMFHILNSFMISKDLIKSIELIDLKGTSFLPYSKLEYMNFIDEVEAIRDKFLNIKEIMKTRFTKMKKTGEQLYLGKHIFIVIDEVGTIGTFPNKKLRDEIFNLMIEIAQKGRAAKILFFIFAQKIDSTNIPSNVLANLNTKILMKTDSDFNINNTIGTKEEIEKITLLHPNNFNHGKCIIKDGLTSEIKLVQVPLITLKKEYR